MNLRVRALDFNYEDDGFTIKDVNVRFDITAEDGNFLSGAVKLTKDEYDSIDTTGISELGNVVKAKIKEEIQKL